MKDLKRITLTGILFVIILGSLWHFVYQWTGNNPVIGLFFPVNESTWEHMKLCFFPMLFYSFYMNRKIRHDYPCISSALLSGILLSTFLVPVIFYTYSGILGHNVLILDIATFIASVLSAFAAVYKFSLSCRLVPYRRILQLSVFTLAVCFFLFTYYPPDIGIFTDPVNITD